MTQQYIKSPLNYIGGKHKLLPQILPLFPTNIDTFVDLFCGGFNVGVNVEANKIIAIDKQWQVIDFLHVCKECSDDIDYMLRQIDRWINEFKLSKTNKDGYLKLRNYYNNGCSIWSVFYTLVCYSFNNQIRFNKKDEFNTPFGMNRSFNSALRKKFIDFVNTLNFKNVEFVWSDFREFDFSKLTNKDFVYADPPYYMSGYIVATYNENGGWTEKDELDLLRLLDRLDNQGVRFALSNVFESKGKSNDLLKSWAKKYRVIELEHTYKNCNYQRKNRDKRDLEVLVVNY